VQSISASTEGSLPKALQDGNPIHRAGNMPDKIRTCICQLNPPHLFVMYTLQPRFWELRIRRLRCGMIFPRPGLGVNKGRDVRGPFDKEQRKNEMSKDLRRI